VRRIFLFVALLSLLGSGGVASADDGLIGPDSRILNNGRQLNPAGTLVDIGNFPTGGAVTPDGYFYWTVSTGRGVNDIRIVSVVKKKVVQVVRIPGASGGIAIDPNRPLAYVSGVADSEHADEQQPDLQGREGDVIHVYRYDRSSGRARFVRVISVPPPQGTPPPQNFPPFNLPHPSLAPTSWPDRLAISRDGLRLLVPLNLADQAAIIDLSSGSLRYVATGSYPYGAAISPDGTTGLVSNEAAGTVSILDLESGTKLGDVDLGHLSHPEAIVIDPSGTRAYVAVANGDYVPETPPISLLRPERVAIIDIPGKSELPPGISTARAAGGGSSPVALALSRGGVRLFVAVSGADAIDVYRTSDLSLIGRIPTSEYPADVQVTRQDRQLLWIGAKGLGVGPNPNGPNPLSPDDSDNAINNFQYLPVLVDGQAGVMPMPTDGQIAAMTPTADAQLLPTNPEIAPLDSPLRPNGPIKHVFYVVRENRTYDQVLGDDDRGDGDSSLTLFGRYYTPNIHALVQRFPLLDHFYANSEASIDGHFWTSAGKVSDYVHKSWFQNYGGRGRPYDFGVYAVTYPQNGFLFDQAERQGISYYNYGEAIAGVVGEFPDKDRTPDVAADQERKLANSDLGPNGCYANDSSVGKDSVTGVDVYDSSLPAGAPPGSTSRFDCFRSQQPQHFGAQIASCTTGELGCQVPAFNYLVMTNDHTQGLSVGARTPRAMIAENDLGLGQLVDLISHSAIWQSSAIFVVEDDSQDGADHVDAHRTVAAVISPYARRGAVVSNRYDQLSMIRSMELILGMQPLGLWDALATPMYDAFQGTPDNSEPYTALPENLNILLRNQNTATNQSLSAGMNMSSIDQVTQKSLDAVLWKSVHGPNSKPPPPGPNAEPETDGR
jgi:DNA-binding beta-propeller fold protein YncE